MQPIRPPVAFCRPLQQRLETASTATRTSLDPRTDTDELTLSVSALAVDLRSSPGNEFVNEIEQGHGNSKNRRRERPGRQLRIASALTMIIGLAGHFSYRSLARPSSAILVPDSVHNIDRGPDTWNCHWNSIVASKANSAVASALPVQTGLIRLAASKVRLVFVELPQSVKVSDVSVMAVSVPAPGNLVVPYHHPDVFAAVSLNTVETGAVLRSFCHLFLSCIRSLAGPRIVGPFLGSPTKVLAK